MNAPAWAASTDVEEFTSAASWLLARTPVRKKVWDLLDERAQRKAFTVAGVAQADVIRDVLLALDRAVANGETLEDFKKRVGQQLVDAWAGSVVNPAWRVETIHRTNVQLAYSAGRYRQMTEPAILKVRPFWQFDAILDNRVTLMCEQADGTILPTEHPWWQTNYPPRHFNCRSVVRSIRKSQAERKGITTDPPTEPSQDGFGLTPDAAEWKPDTKKYPPEIRKELEARLKRLDKRPIQRTPKPKPEKAAPKAKAGPKPEHTVEHWEKQFSPKYGDAAKAMAWGRAAQERGLDMTAEQGIKLCANAAQLFPFSEWRIGQLAKKMAAASPGTPLRDVLASEAEQKALATILGHIGSVKSKKGTAHVVSIRTAVLNPGKPATSDLKESKRLLDSLLDKDTGARVQLVWISEDARAACNPFEKPPRIRVNCGPNIVHEWGHAIEAQNPKVSASAKALLAKRTAGESAKPLSQLTGQRYKADEIAKPDGWFDAYCGKIYSTGDTELLSMGMERLAGYPFTFYADDSEHFWWVLGCLGGYA